jgi:hypothetical protein
MSGDGARVAYPLFQEGDGGPHPTSPLQFAIYEISTELAVELNRKWHSVLPEIKNPRGDAICFGAEFEGRVFACAIWTIPVARLLNGRNWLELRRMAISGDAPKNTASRMLSIMTRLIRVRKPHIVKLISYQDTEIHSGTIYKASGWKMAGNYSSRSRTWVNKARVRKEVQTTAPKMRWEKDLTQRPCKVKPDEREGKDGNALPLRLWRVLCI